MDRQVTEFLSKKRFDYFLIWGHGAPYREDILDIIRKQPFLDITKIINHKPKDIAKLVRTIYSHDYAPLQHLKSKTKYLLRTSPEVTFIFVHNLDAKEVYLGQGAFRHIECERIKDIKNAIRDKFNPRKDGKRTEDHVIHASDNEPQVHHILKYLGYQDGIAYFRNTPNPLLNLPCHLTKFTRFSVKQINLSQMFCTINGGNRTSYKKQIVKIAATPHFACLTGAADVYQQYLSEFGGYLLADDHSVEKLLSLSSRLSYLEAPHSTAYILTEEFAPGQYVIRDGVHRASILKFRGVNSAPVAVIRNNNVFA